MILRQSLLFIFFVPGPKRSFKVQCDEFELRCQTQAASLLPSAVRCTTLAGLCRERQAKVFDAEGFRITKLACNNGLPYFLKNQTERMEASQNGVHMKDNSVTMAKKKTVAIVAHDNKKQDLLAWAKFNREALAGHKLIATGTTGKLLHTELDLPVERLQSGPLGGDQQVGAKISEGEIDVLIFFWDPLEPHPHDPDVKALLRIAVVWNIPIACNRASADFLISSSLMPQEYQRLVPDYEGHRNRLLRLDVA